MLVTTLGFFKGALFQFVCTWRLVKDGAVFTAQGGPAMPVRLVVLIFGLHLFIFCIEVGPVAPVRLEIFSMDLAFSEVTLIPALSVVLALPSRFVCIFMQRLGICKFSLIVLYSLICLGQLSMRLGRPALPAQVGKNEIVLRTWDVEF